MQISKWNEGSQQNKKPCSVGDDTPVVSRYFECYTVLLLNLLSNLLHSSLSLNHCQPLPKHSIPHSLPLSLPSSASLTPSQVLLIPLPSGFNLLFLLRIVARKPV